MLLSELITKPLYVGKTPRGYCVGVGVSLKSLSVKYLLCVHTTQNPPTQTFDFAVNVSCIKDVDTQIHLSRVRHSYPKNCVKVFIGCPIYSVDGSFLGNIADLDLDDFYAVRLHSDKSNTFSFLSVMACSDAILLRKEQPFPIGQRVHAPLVSSFFDNNPPIITKPVLRDALQNGTIVRLTSTLPPFSTKLNITQSSKKKFFRF